MSKRDNIPSDKLVDLPERIDRLRWQLKINSAELARLLGVSRSYVTNLRKGHHCSLPVLTLFEKLERDSFPPVVEAREVMMPQPPATGIQPPVRGVGGFQSFPGGRLPAAEHQVPPVMQANGVDLNQPLVEVEHGELKVPLLVGGTELPKNLQPAFLPFWRQYDVATRPLMELSEIGKAGGYLTTDVEDSRAFAMRVEGDEMAPMIFGGDSIVLSPKEPIRTGGVALARLREVDGGGVLLRQVMLTERGRVLGKEPGAGVRLDECVWVVAVWAVMRRL